MPASCFRRRWLVGILVAAAIAALLLVALPALKAHMARERFAGMLNNARQLQIAIETRQLDAAADGASTTKTLPFDVGARSAREFFGFLVRDGYVAAADLDKLLPGLTVTNASRKDPPDTALIVSESLARDPSGGFVVFTLGGAGGTFRRNGDVAHIKLPPRTPAILPRE